MTAKLVLPSVKYKDSYLTALDEYHAENLPTYEYIYRKDLGNNFDQYVSQLLGFSKGEGLPTGYVPHTELWLVDRGEYIGRVDIRHALNNHLLNIGGHIGYNIRSSKRGLGYGKQILSLSLPWAKKIGLDRALVTCDVSNLPSKKIIERNGGVFENSYAQGGNLPDKLRYWIALT